MNTTLLARASPSLTLDQIQMRTKGEGVKKSKKIMDIISGSSPIPIHSTAAGLFARTDGQSSSPSSASRPPGLRFGLCGGHGSQSANAQVLLLTLWRRRRSECGMQKQKKQQCLARSTPLPQLNVCFFASLYAKYSPIAAEPKPFITTTELPAETA